MLEVLLYILLPDEDFQCKPLRFLLRDIFSNGVILPLFDLISDPDYINQVIFWIVSFAQRFLFNVAIFLLVFQGHANIQRDISNHVEAN